MNIHEHQAKQILKKYGAVVPEGIFALTVDELVEKAKSLKTEKYVLKAQIHAGGRGKAGGVKILNTIEELKIAAQELLGKTLVTHQTGPEGREVKRLYVEKSSNIDKEFYLSCLVDRASSKIAFISSDQGGMDIEEVAAIWSLVKIDSTGEIAASLESSSRNRSKGAKFAKADKVHLQGLITDALLRLQVEDLTGSDSLVGRKKKETRKSVLKPFKKLKNKNVEVDVKATDLKIKHSKKTVKTEKKNSKSKKGRAVKASIAIKGLSDLSKGSSKRRPTQSSPLEDMLKMIGVINARLPQVVRKNMGTPELNNVTGRFANSVQVTEVIKTPQGFPSIGYTYQKAPYQVFEDGVGAAPWANGQRDPRNLIDRSIREISAEMFVGRLYTRRI